MRLQLVRTDNLALQVVRALALVGTTGFAMMAFRSMPLAEATAVLFLAPLMVTLLAGPFLHERIGAGRWAAVDRRFRRRAADRPPGRRPQAWRDSSGRSPAPPATPSTRS
jgi:hypothetical protein